MAHEAPVPGLDIAGMYAHLHAVGRGLEDILAASSHPGFDPEITEHVRKSIEDLAKAAGYTCTRSETPNTSAVQLQLVEPAHDRIPHVA